MCCYLLSNRHRAEPVVRLTNEKKQGCKWGLWCRDTYRSMPLKYYFLLPNHHTTLALHWLFYDDWVSRCTGLFETQIFTKPQWKWPYINQPHTHSFLSLMWNAVKETHKPCPQLHSLTWKPRWELSWQEAHTNLRQAKALFRHALRGESLYLCPSWKSSHPVPSAGWISNDLLAGQDGREMWSSGGGTPTSLAHIPPSVLL